jgi:hypothetical protein
MPLNGDVRQAQLVKDNGLLQNRYRRLVHFPKRAKLWREVLSHLVNAGPHQSLEVTAHLLFIDAAFERRAAVL